MVFIRFLINPSILFVPKDHFKTPKIPKYAEYFRLNLNALKSYTFLCLTLSCPQVLLSCINALIPIVMI